MQVGSLVECIGAFTSPSPYNEQRPVVGEIYTIRDIIEDNGIFVRLEEIINNQNLYYYRGLPTLIECCFNIKKFRELQPPINIDIESIIEETIEA